MGNAKVVDASEKFICLIIRRPHAYWFNQQYSSAPIPGIAVLDASRKIVDTFPLLLPGQTAEKLASKLQAISSKKQDDTLDVPVKPKEGKRATFRVQGMKKTA